MSDENDEIDEEPSPRRRVDMTQAALAAVAPLETRAVLVGRFDRSRRLLAACAVALALTACQSEEQQRVPAGEKAPLSEPAAIGVARVINEGIVDQAAAVQGRLTDTKARRFAELMIREHGAANERLNALAGELALAPEDSDLRQELARESQQVVQRLHAASAGEVDRAYLDEQVVAHRRALDLLDNRLLPVVAQTERLHQELAFLRGQVFSHLAQVEELSAK